MKACEVQVSNSQNSQVQALTSSIGVKGSIHTSSQLESLKFLLSLQRLDGAFMDPTWNEYDKLSAEILSPCFMGPKPMDFNHSVAFREWSLFTMISSLTSHFKHGPFTLAWTILSLKIG
jgi:hypothetical protein